MDPQIDQLPPTLIDLLTNPIITDNLYQYLPRSSIFRLCRTARLYREIILNTPKVFRYLDLSTCKGAYTPVFARHDAGGNTWRAERIDETVSEDEFLAGPLRSVLNKLQRLKALQDVQTLVLDGLGSVTHDLVFEIITLDSYKVRLLSIRQCPNINQSRLQQSLRYICRPGRPEGTPRLQGLYFFTNPAGDYATRPGANASTGITGTDGATLGLLPVDKGQLTTDNANCWYSASGRVLSIGADIRSSWEETLQTCHGIIAFDAVLCQSMHSHAAPCLHDASRDFLQTSKPGVPTIATIALGSEGCSGCGKAPEGTPIWGESPVSEFPLLAPPPWSGKLKDAIRPPISSTSANPPRLIVSCKWCLVNRHCDSCHRWWCADCYNPKQSKNLRDLEALSNAGIVALPTPQQFQPASSSGSTGSVPTAQRDSIKVFNGFCVENCLVGEMMAGAGSFGMWA